MQPFKKKTVNCESVKGCRRERQANQKTLRQRASVTTATTATTATSIFEREGVC